MAKKSRPSPWQSGLPTRSNTEDVPWRGAPNSHEKTNRHSQFPSGRSRLQFKSKYEKDKNISCKRPYHSSVTEDSDSRLPNEINAENYEPTPKKRTSDSVDYVSSSSSMHSCDARPMLQKRSSVQEGKHMPEEKGSNAGNSVDSWQQKKKINTDDGKNMPEMKGSASSDWDSWPQKKSGAEDSKHMSQKRGSSSGDHVGLHCHRPPWKSRLEKRSDFKMDKALVHEGGHNSSYGASRWVSPRSKSLVKTIAKETNDSPWKSSNNSSDYLQLSSSRRAWKSELQIRSNVEVLKNTLEERTSRVIKSLKEDGLKSEVYSTKARPHKREQSSADGAKLHSEWPNWESRLQGRFFKGDSMDSPGNSSIWEESNEDAANPKPNKLMPNTTDHAGSPSRSNVENTNNRSVERAETNVCPWESLQERSNSTGEAKDGLLQGANNSIGDAEPPALPTQNSNVQKSKDSKEVKNRFGKKAFDSYDHPSRNLEEQRVEDAHEARDVHNKGVNIGLDSQAHTSCLSMISCREERNLEKEKARPNEVGFDKIDGEGLSHGRASWDSRTQIERNEGSKDGLLELSISSLASWNCTEQRNSNLMKGNDTSTLRAFNIIDAAELPSDRTSTELRMMQRGKEQAKDGSDEKLPNRIDSNELQSSWHSHEPNLQIRSNLEEPKCGSNKKASNRTYSTELLSIWHSHESNMQRSNLEDPKAIPDKSHVQRKGTLEEPKNKPDERTLKGTNDADCRSMFPCVESKPQRSISAEEIEVSPRKQTSDPHGVQFPFISMDYMQKGNMRASEITDGAGFPSTSPCKDLRLQRSISAKEIKVSPRKEAPNLVHDVEFLFISRDYKLQKGNDEDAKDILGGKASNLIVGTTFPLNRPVSELEIERKRNTEEAGDRVDGKVVVPKSQSNTQVPDVDVLSCSKDFNASRLQNLVSDSAYFPSPSSKHPISPAIINSTTIAPNCTKCIETENCNDLHISHAIFTRSQNCPAKKCIWMGSFKVTDIASVVRVYEGFVAHPSFKVCRRAYEFSKEMPSTVEFLIHPRCNYWPLIFEDCPDTNDIALYFYPRNKEAVQCYASLLRFIDNKDLMLRSQMGRVELLVFPSRLLDVRCQTIENHYFFWGVFHTKR